MYLEQHCPPRKPDPACHLACEREDGVLALLSMSYNRCADGGHKRRWACSMLVQHLRLKGELGQQLKQLV